MSARSNMFNRRALPWLLSGTMFAVLLHACGSPNSNPDGVGAAPLDTPVSESLEARFDEIREIHDEVMPERGKLIRLQRKVDAEDLEPSQQAFAKTRLQRADDMMMSWMYADQSLTTLADSLSEAEIQSYLNRREREIRAVADSMRAAIDFAQLVVAQ